MRIATFASGSSGNCTLVSSGNTHILIDAGISMKRIRMSLAELGLTFNDLSGILITHSHSDHISGLGMLVKHTQPIIFAPHIVAGALRRAVAGVENCVREIAVGESFSLGEASVMAFTTSHDTEQSVGYIIEADCRFGFCTDTGCVTEDMLRALSASDAVLLEANHDVDMLRTGPYPYYLKQRILSERGHLSNEACGELAIRLVRGGARAVILGHLSHENNTPQAARNTVWKALEGAGFDPCGEVRLCVAPRSEMRCLTLEKDEICWG